MNPKESDPSGAFSGGGAAGLESTEGQDSGKPATEDVGHAGGSTTEVDQAERDVVTSGTAATSEIADPEAKRTAEQQGDGTPLPR